MSLSLDFAPLVSLATEIAKLPLVIPSVIEGIIVFLGVASLIKNKKHQ